MNGRSFRIVLGALAILVIVIGATAYVMWRVLPRRLEQALLKPKEEVVDLSTVVTQVRELHRLETASMRVVNISTIKQSYQMVPNALAGDELTFLAAGDVIAGIDMSQLKREDIWREADGTVVMRLPPPMILVTRVDNRESRVINRKTGVLRRADVNLESRARQLAEQSIRNEAMKKNILPLAATNAEQKLANFVLAIGVKKVRFVSGGPAPAPAPR